MEIVETCSEVLPNRQVLDMLKNYSSRNQTNLATILYETTSYLESSPAATSSLSDLSEFLDIIKERGWDLTKMEKVQLVNLKPKNEAELLIIIDNIDEKLDENQRADLIDLIQTHLEKCVVEQQPHPTKRQKG